MTNGQNMQKTKTLLRSNVVLTCLTLLFASACGDANDFVPKPPTYLRLNLPDHQYKLYSDHCPFQFELSTLFTVKEVMKNECHKDIALGPLNGVIHFSYIDMLEPLSKYVNYSIDKVEDHKVKATAINDTQFIDTINKVYGTFFELQGDVASPFQFYLTDSTKRFVNAVVYFNSPPNYDSLKPSLNYLKKDLFHLIESFKWKPRS